MVRYADVPASNRPTISLNAVLINNSFSRLHLYSDFAYRLRKTVFEGRLKAHKNSCCYPALYCVNVYGVHSLVRLGLLVSVLDWWPMYDCSRLRFVPTPIVGAKYSNLVMSRRAPELKFCIAVFELCVCALGFLLISALIGDLLGSRSDYAGVADNAARGYMFLHLTAYLTLYNLFDFLGLCCVALLI